MLMPEAHTGTIAALISADERDVRLASAVHATTGEPVPVALLGTSEYRPGFAAIETRDVPGGTAVVYDSTLLDARQVAELLALIWHRPVEVISAAVAR